jgi:curved DNA-binding protein
MTLNEVNLNVKIPKGIKEGQHIRLSGQGKPGIGGGPAGDLYLKVHFLPHPYFKVEGNDLYLDLPVAPWEAALGAKVEVPTPTGKVKLAIPANAKQGQKMRLKGKGLPSKTPGDLYAVINIAMPDNNERAKDEWLKLKEKLDFNPRAHLS